MPTTQEIHDLLAADRKTYESVRETNPFAAAAFASARPHVHKMGANTKNEELRRAQRLSTEPRAERPNPFRREATPPASAPAVIITKDAAPVVVVGGAS